MGLADWGAGKVLDHSFGIAGWTIPANWYAAAYTTAPSDADAGGVEVTGNAYARVAVPTSGTYWTRSGRLLTNALAITFPTATPATWGTVVAIGLRDASSGGNLFALGLLIASRVVGASSALIIPAGDMDFQVVAS